MGAPTLPLIGDILGHTLSPLISRAAWPLMMRTIFGPRSVPQKFEAFPKEMAVRASQIRSSAAELTLMILHAFKLRNQYEDLKMPVAIIAGDQDRVVDIDSQSARLHLAISQSRFHRFHGNGHMIQLSHGSGDVGDPRGGDQPIETRGSGIATISSQLTFGRLVADETRPALSPRRRRSLVG
jgi:pimeloyl-ACP methyl ester carboxylesterase